MSGGSKRQPSKWDNRDSEDFYDRASPRRPRELFSPDRGSRQHDSHSRENTMTLDRERNFTRISPELDDWRHRHSSQSPRNDSGRSHRINRSRSRSRSQSPGHNYRREPGVNDRSRNRSGTSGKMCRDFAAGRCRRGHSCHFLHQDAQRYDSRQPLECGPPDDWEGRHRRTGRSRYSSDDVKDDAIMAEKSAHICNEFLKGRCRRGDTCRFVHHDSSDVFEEGPGEEVYRNRDHERRSRDVRDRSRDTYPDHDRRSRDTRDTYPDQDYKSRDTYPDRDNRSRDIYPDHDHRSRDTDTYPDREHRSRDRNSDHDHRSRDSYPDHDHRSRDRYSDQDHRRKDVYSDRNHESEPRRSGVIPCKFFASGNCRNGGRCRFSHQVEEVFNPEKRSRDDKCDTDRKFEGNQGWDGPGWGDVTTGSAIPTVPGWKEVRIKNKNEGDQVWNGPGWDDSTAGPAISTVPGWAEDNIKIKNEGDQVMNGSGWGDVTTVSAIPTVPGWEEDKSKSKNEGHQVGNGPSWTDATSVPIVQEVRGWGDDNDGIKKVAKDVTGPRPMDDSSSHDMVIKPTWDPPATSIDKSQIKEKEDPLQWKTETNISVMGLSAPRGEDLSSGNVESSPTDIKQQPMFNSSTVQTLPSSNIAFATVQQGTTGDTSFVKHYHTDLFGKQNPNYEDNKPVSYSSEERNVVGDHDSSSILQNQAITIPQNQVLFHSDINANVHPISNITPPSQSQTPVLSHAPQGDRIPVSYKLSSLENQVVAGPHTVGLASNAPTQASIHSTVSNEQLAQLSHLTASLTQLLENRQQLSQISSSLPDLEAHVPPVSGPTIELNQVPDPGSSSIEQKNAISEIYHEGYNSNVQEHIKPLKDEGNGKDTAGLKEAENGPSQDVGHNDAADDGKKLIDMKGVRPFKFVLVEFVKELLKPSWKDGQVSKEAYKTIVKKVVDKVMDTLGPHIPQTQEKIDLYISCSKPKIEKLVQAYVGKHLKG